MDNEEIKKLAEAAQIQAEPIDFDQLLEDGLLIQKGQSYYAPNVKALPDKVSQRINSIANTKNGVKVTFSKETKSIQKLAKKLEGYLD